MIDTPEPELPSYDTTRTARASSCPICGSTDIDPAIVWQEGDRVHRFCSEEHKHEFQKQRAAERTD